jgi:uncharacterized protein YbjT (DUF2867 family)
LISLAKKTAVKKIVKSSAFAASLHPPVGYGITHAASEHQLMNSELEWVIYRPYMFMQNFLDLSDLIKSPGFIPMPLRSSKIALIDARDVALAAFIALTEEGHAYKLYDLSGPEALSMSECASLMSRLMGRRIRYLSPPYWLAGLMMRAQGEAAWDVMMRKQLFNMICDGGEARITNDFERLCKKKPRTLIDFIRDHLAMFDTAHSK